MMGDQDRVGQGFRWRKMTLRQILEMRRLHEAGLTASELGARYHVSQRTIYRYLAATTGDVVLVTIGEWVAEFVVTDEGPLRMTSWYAKS